ncbi:MAG: phenylalanine--tRNA ligase subunit alpha [Candidatus Micrarchaeota archaeon]|nr:phenylalanine--tRNA ligase subunit alpha [Candidatus Micrarchaeota archaeon]
MLHQYEKLVLHSLKAGSKTLDELADSTGLNKDSASRACYWLKDKGAVEIHETVTQGFKLGEEGKKFLESGFPEFNLIKKLHAGKAFSELSDEEKRIGLPWAKRKEWLEIEGNIFKLSKLGEKILREGQNEVLMLKKISEAKSLGKEDIDAVKALLGRGDVLRTTESKQLSLSITKKGEGLAGKEAADIHGEIHLHGDVGARKLVNTLTKEDITTGRWKEKEYREYDDSPVERSRPGKKHPLRKAISRIRKIFLELGFEEMEDRLVESSFWNFDALFQPQDHPARDLMDTFYLSSPEKISLPKDEVVDRVKKAHEEKWKYKWSREVAEQAVLRTHDTAISPQYMLKVRKGEKKAPAKFFAVGRVYRNEATDFKHLSEFYQVGGIIVYEDATFRDLLGLLKEFYRKLGFEKIRFIPNYFPYTEPSVQVEVYYEDRKQWLELGGAGVFRPEVCLPTWGKYPVLAWGLGLERPVMLMMGVKDIRQFYRNDVSWLREARV